MLRYQLPSSQHAVLQGEDGQARFVSEAAIPSLPPGFVLVKTFAVALNHSDHKVLNNFPIPGAYVGTDFSGTVVQLADDVDPGTLPLGTMVSGIAFCFSPTHRRASGAFAEYVRARADLLFRVPSPDKDTVGPLQAATLGTAIATCILALWSPDALGLPGTPAEPEASEKRVPVLVYGGSTATGTIALQLLRLSGYDPIATCSPHNFDLVRERGASAVFDYADPGVAAAAIRSHTGGRLKYALDCISDAGSVAVCYGAIQRPGGRYACLEIVADELLAKRRAVRPTFVLAAEVYGEEISLGHVGYDRSVSREKHQLAVQYTQMIQRVLDQRRLKVHPIELLPGGLQGVVRGLKVLETSGVSGKKLVAVIE